MTFEEFFAWFARTLTIGTVTGATYWGLNQLVAWRARQPILWAVAYTRRVDSWTRVILHVRNRAQADLLVLSVKVVKPKDGVAIDGYRREGGELDVLRHIKPSPPLASEFPSTQFEFQCEPADLARAGITLNVRLRRPRVWFLPNVTNHRVQVVMSDVE